MHIILCIDLRKYSLNQLFVNISTSCNWFEIVRKSIRYGFYPRF